MATLAMFYCLLFLLSLSSSTFLPVQQPLYSVPGATELRNATLDDVDDITDIMVAAYSSTNFYNYCFQFRQKYPEEHWTCQRDGLRVSMEEYKDQITVNVITSPTNEDPSVSKPVAVAAWAHSGIGAAAMSGVLANCQDQRDMNRTRADDFNGQLANAKAKYLDNEYGSDQVYLALLATHPDYQGRGFGERQCLLGIERAREISLPVTLMATPAGYQVYHSLGFKSLTNFTISTVDADDLFWFEVMRYDTNTGETA